VAAPAEASASAGASTSAEPGKFVLGLRLGYGLPMGSIMKGDKMSDAFSGMIPIWLDVGYMVTPNIMVGVYGNYGIVSLKDCSGDCSASQLRFGVQGQYHISPAEKLDPWFGLGIGYEKMSVKAGGDDGSISGMEYLNLQAGLDYKLSPAFGLGPFLSFSLGQYGSASSGGVSADIPETAMHQWLTLGVRGAFNL
jgi:outer membrane protein W